MTTRAPPGKPSAEKPASRHVYGPRVIGAVLPSVTRPVFRSQGVALGQLAADWPGIVGARLAAMCTPRRMAAGTLTLGCAGPVALELQHLVGPLIERINGYMGQAAGKAAVQRLRFVQEAVSTPPAPPPPRPALVPVEVPGMADGPLRAALAALGAAVRAGRG